MADGVRDSPRLDPGAGQDERHVKRAVIGEVAVGELPMLAQGLTVVGGDRDDGPSLPSLGPEGGEEPGELSVHERRFARIGVLGELGQIGLGRGVRGVGVPEVDPAEPFSRPAQDPGHGRIDDLLRAPLRVVARRAGRGEEGVVVDVEPLVEPEPRIERKSPDEGARGVALGLEMLGQGQEGRGNLGLRVLAHPMEEGRRAEKDVGVGGQGDGIVGVSVFEQHAAGGHGVDRGRLDGFGAVAAEPVRAEGVDCDQQ